MNWRDWPVSYPNKKHGSEDPNFYFQITAAYNILRHNGVEIGNKDFLGSSRRVMGRSDA